LTAVSSLTRWILAHKRIVVVGWVALTIAGIAASGPASERLVNDGSVPDTEIKMFATALATGILVDATVIRALIVPAVVLLMGRWNWWLPRVPARLLRVEPSVPPHVASSEAN